MSPKLSIVIPTLNASTELPATAETLMEGLHAGIIREMIVTDGGSGDTTAKVADALGATFVQGPASRGGQLRRGCGLAQADWLLVLHADTWLQAGWTAEVRDHISSGQGAAYFQLRFRASGLFPAWTAGWANLRAKWFGLPYGDQGLLISRAAYEAAGGFPDQPLMEDVALMRRLRAAKVPVVGLKSQALTSAERYRKAGWIRRGSRNLWTLARYFAGTAPDRLATQYRR